MMVSKSCNFCQEILNELASANAKLEARNVRLKIEPRGSQLSLRGIFPPKPYFKEQIPRQQNLFFQSGNYVSNENVCQSIRNIKQVCREAEQIYKSILRGEFDWNEHMIHQKKLKQFLEAQERTEQERNKKMTFQEIFSEFEEDFFKYSPSGDKPKVWKVLKRNLKYLDSDDEFSLELFESKALEFIRGIKTKPAQGVAQKKANQFLKFLEREGLTLGGK